MAAPVYYSELRDTSLAESLTNYIAINQGGGGGGSPALGPDLAMQGANCVDRAVNNTERSIAYTVFNGTVDAESYASYDYHVYQWIFNATPGISATIANRGVCVIIGPDTNNYIQYHVDGSDTYGASGRVGRCYPIRYIASAPTTVTPPYRTRIGNPVTTIGTLGVVGGSLNITAGARGSNLGVDAIRFGNGGTIAFGEIANPATFQGYSATNDFINNRWGILSNIGGALELQGRLIIGIRLDNFNQLEQVTYFEESGFSILIPDTPHTSTTFNRIWLKTSGSTVNWSSGSITALGTNSKGDIDVDRDNIIFNVSGGSWTSIGKSSLNDYTTINGLTWRDCDLINQNGATITNSSINNTTLIPSNFNTITKNNFISGGANHAVEIDNRFISRSGGTTPHFAGTPVTFPFRTPGKAFTVKHVLRSGTNRIIIFMMNNVGGGQDTANGGILETVTYGGVAMTRILNISEYNFSYFYLLEADLPTQNDVIYDVVITSRRTEPVTGIITGLTYVQQVNNARQAAFEIGAFFENQNNVSPLPAIDNVMTSDNGLVLRLMEYDVNSGKKLSTDTTTLYELELKEVNNGTKYYYVDYIQGGLNGTTTTIQDVLGVGETLILGRDVQTVIVYPESLIDPLVEQGDIFWDNTTEGFATIDGSTGNEAINLTATSGNLTINTTSTATIPTVQTAGATFNIIAAQIVLTLTNLVVNTEVRIYEAGTLTELAGVENSGTTFGYNYTFAPSTFVDIVVHNIDYQYIKLFNIELGASNASLPIQQRFDRNYTNPAGPSPDITLFSGVSPRSEWVVTYDFALDTSSITLYWEDAIVFTESVAGFNQELFDSVSRIGTDSRRYLRSTFQLSLGEFTGTEDGENYYSITQKGI